MAARVCKRDRLQPLVGALLWLLLGSVAWAQPEPDSLAERWARLLVRGDAFTSLEAENALVRLGPEARPVLERLLQEGSRRREWQRAARVLGRLGDRRARPALHRFLQRRKTDPLARLEAARALLRLGDRYGIDVALELLADSDRSIRLGALLLFARYTHRDFGFRFDGPSGERAAALRRMRAWWESVRRDAVLVGP
ncbi:MAG: HEAT repeat domain-containing protein [Planctomycetota bacterium]|nr:MAG: HEAT repeat domain-containing protein [Planctomycetota bacterium]